VQLVVRRGSRRVARRWLSSFRGDYPDAAGRILLINGDLDSGDLIEATVRSRVLEDTTSVIHCAAVTRLDADHQLAWRTNVGGTGRLLALAGEMQQLRTFVHISDLAVAGDHRGAFAEADLLRNQRFSGVYAQTKLVAERRVREASSSLPVRIVRPAGFVGPLDQGSAEGVASLQSLLAPLVQLSRLPAGLGMLPFVPLGTCARVQVLPLDWVAEAVLTLWQQPGLDGQTFQVHDPDAPTLRAFLDACCDRLGMPSLAVDIPRNLWGALAHNPLGDLVISRLPLPSSLRADAISRVVRCSVPDGTGAERVLRAAELKPPHLPDYLGALLEYTEASAV
jgi:nucleoside-diphosphate-sugar epimerase